MATTMTLIAKQTVGSGGASTVIFSNIPQAYTDIKVVYSARCSDTTNNWNVLTGYFNADSTSGNYPGSTTYAFSSATGATTVNKWFGYLPNASGWFGGAFGNGEFYIPNYSVNGVAKTVNVESAAEGNSTTLVPMQLTVTRWTGTAPITTITLSCDTGNFLENSTFYLYGVSNSSTQNTTVPYASGGDVITTDGTYWYHTFLYSGTFTPLKNLTCDYLVVAGGGGGGFQNAGGGGGGGLRSTVTATGGGGSLETPLALLANTVYTATVGAGGNAGSASGNRGSNGSNSIFSTITSTGGGAGGSYGSGQVIGAAGGSGGGTGSNNGVSETGGAGTANQGYAGGGNPNGYTTFCGAGGGGAGAIGSNIPSGGNGGNGGNGVATSISGSSVTYAGGGGGGGTNTAGTGGTGGGGNGGQGASGGSVGSPGTANRGGGGGGSRDNVAGGNGGSGIIVVRYAV